MVAIIPRLPKRVAWNCPDDQEFPNRATETEVDVATFWGPPVRLEAFFTLSGQHCWSRRQRGL
jgi:hypothetical protein